jgi:hypothetical protein
MQARVPEAFSLRQPCLTDSAPLVTWWGLNSGLDHGVGHLVAMTTPDHQRLDLTEG